MAELNTFLGGGSAATSVNGIMMSNNVPYSSIANIGATSVSASVTSTTLADVLNITGSGYITFLALHTANASNLTDAKLTVVVDGVTAFSDLAIGAVTNANLLSLVGSYMASTSGNIFSESIMPFNQSLVIQVAGDGTNGAVISYKRTLT